MKKLPLLLPYFRGPFMATRCGGSGAHVEGSNAQSPITPTRCPKCGRVAPVGKDSGGLHFQAHDADGVEDEEEDPPGAGIAGIFFRSLHAETLAEIRGLRADIRELAKAVGLLREEAEITRTVIKGWSDRAAEIEREKKTGG